MARFLERYSEPFYTLLRIVAGFLYACHGAQKLFGVLGGKVMISNPLMLAAGVIELGGGILIALGLFTRPVAFLASGQMAVAYFKAHAPQGFWPIQNGGELAALYCFLWLYVAGRGGGRYSLDGMGSRGRTDRTV
jgi:putative oxidoreductase